MGMVLREPEKMYRSLTGTVLSRRKREAIKAEQLGLRL